MPDDEVVDDDDEWDDEEWEEEDLLFGYPARTVKITAGATAVVVLLLLAALVSSSFGFYKGVGQISVTIDYGQIEPTSAEIKARIYLAAPFMGRLGDGEGTYEVSYDREVRHTDKFSYDSGGLVIITIYLEDFFVENGVYTLTVEADDKNSEDSVELNRIAKHTWGLMNFHGGAEAYESENPALTLKFNSLAGNDESPAVYPVGEGYVEIYFFANNAPDGNEEWRECYWNDDNPQCGPERSEGDWVKVDQKIFFNISGDSYSWNLEDDSLHEYTNTDIYTIELSRGDFEQSEEGDYTFRIFFTNQFGDDPDTDTTQKEGRSYWNWFYLDGTG